MMTIFQQTRKFVMALMLVLVLFTASACGGATTQASRNNAPPALTGTGNYNQIQRGNSSSGQDFGNWVVQTAKGLVQDAYVRDQNKLGVVISPKVKPTEVKTLANSILQGFERNFPHQDLTVLMYAPDKKLILTAKYDEQSKKIQYQ